MADYTVPERRVPASVVTMHDIGKLQRELATINTFFANAARRQAGSGVGLPVTTSQLQNLARQFDCNLLHQEDRTKLETELHNIRHYARPLDISFAGIPSPMFLQKIVTWFRNNVDADIVLNVGHEPSIAAGCVVRTPRNTYDFSISKKLADQRKTLLEAIRQ